MLIDSEYAQIIPPRLSGQVPIEGNSIPEPTDYVPLPEMPLSDALVPKQNMLRQALQGEFIRKAVKRTGALALSVTVAACAPLATARHFEPFGNYITATIWGNDEGGVLERADVDQRQHLAQREGWLVIPGYGQRDPFETASALVNENSDTPFTDVDAPIASVAPPASGFEIAKLREDIVLFCRRYNIDEINIIGISAGSLWALDAIEGTNLKLHNFVMITSPSQLSTTYDSNGVAAMAQFGANQSKSELLVGRLIEAGFLAMREGNIMLESIGAFALRETQTGASPELFMKENILIAESDVIHHPAAFTKNIGPNTQFIYVRPKDATSDPVVKLVESQADYQNLATKLGVRYTALEIPEPGHAQSVDAATHLANLLRYQRSLALSYEMHDPSLNKLR